MKVSSLFVILSLAFISILGFSGCDDGSESNQPHLFRSLPVEHTGVSFVNELEDTPEFNLVNYLNFYNGAGVAVGDVNNDGLLDLYFTSNVGANRLYLNKGEMRFEDVTERAGVGGTGNWTTGVNMVDINADGYLDLYVSAVGGYLDRNGRNQLFINNGDGTFSEQAKAYGLDFYGYGQHAAFFDYDLDGDLDMYLLRHSTHAEGTYGNTMLRAMRHDRAGDRLLRNDGGTFTDVSEQAGIYGAATGYGLSVSVRDYDFDGCPDIFVANDFHENDFLYYNNCDGTFTESIYESMNHVTYSSMGSDAGDLDNDGLLDIVVLDMLPDREDIRKTANPAEPFDIYDFKRDLGYHHQYPRNMVHLNQGNRRFSEIGYLLGVHATDWSWGPLIVDLDNDGLRDIFIANGVWRRFNDLDYSRYIGRPDVQASFDKGFNKENLKKALEQSSHVPIPNYAFKNEGGLSFTNVTAAWGLAEPGFSNGAVYADLDNDGDLDLIVNNLNQPASIYENLADTLTDNHYLMVKLEGAGANPQGIGAKVLLKVGDKLLIDEQMTARGWMSSVDPRLHFGLGQADTVDSLYVIWPDRRFQVLTDVRADSTIVLNQNDASGSYHYTPLYRTEALFEDVTHTMELGYRHKETQYYDYNREPLMPHMVSREGPALAVGDVNGDGLDDFFVGGAKWQPARLYIQQANGRFEETNKALWSADSLYEDVDAVFFDANGDGSLDLYVVSGGNEWWGKQEALRDRLYLNDGRGTFQRSEDALPELYENGSRVVPADFDSDGDVDLFVGSRVVARNYGASPQSYLLENDGKGHFSDVTLDRAEELSEIGMVTDAVWTDVDRDGHVDLVVVGEWMPLTVFRQQDGRFVNYTEEAGFGHTHGWWNSVTAADLNGDGYDDLIAGNLGLNSVLKTSPEQPIQLFMKDFDGDGNVEQILTYYNHGTRYPFFSVDQLVGAVETLQQRYVSYKEFGDSQIEDLFGRDAVREATVHNAYTFASCYALNNGDGTFTLHSLPLLAQFSTVNAIVTDDFDRDGIPDLLLAGNKFDVQPLIERHDASWGAYLRGRGDGTFEALTPYQSGLYVEGAVRNLEYLRRADGTRVLLAARNNAPLQIVMPTRQGPSFADL